MQILTEQTKQHVEKKALPDHILRKEVVERLYAAKNAKVFNEKEFAASQSADPLLEEFYYPGCEELAKCRKNILLYSLQAAGKRLPKEKAFYASAKPHILKNARESLYRSLRQAKLCGSQIAAERSVSGCCFARLPDAGCGAEEAPSLVSGDWTGTVKFWRISDLTMTAAWKNHHASEKISCVASFCSQSRSMIGSCDFGGLVKVCIGSTQQPKTLSLSGHSSRATKMSFHPSGEYAGSVSTDRSFRLWDLAAEKCILHQESHRKEAFCLAFHPDGSLVSTGGAEGVGRVWDLRTGNAIMNLVGHSGGLLSMSMSPDGHSIATAGDDNTLKIYDLRMLREKVTILAHKSLVSACKYDEVSGAFIVSASYDGTVKIFGAYDHALILECDLGPTTKVTSIDCVTHGDNVCIGCSTLDKTVKLWQAPINSGV